MTKEEIELLKDVLSTLEDITCCLEYPDPGYEAQAVLRRLIAKKEEPV